MSEPSEPQGSSLSSTVLVAVLCLVFAVVVGRQIVGSDDTPVDNGFGATITLPLSDAVEDEEWTPPTVGRDPFDPGEIPIVVPSVDDDLDDLTGDATTDEADADDDTEVDDSADDDG